MTNGTHAIYDQLPSTTRAERTGRNPIEQMAIEVVRREIAAMPASLVVQLALWPGEVAAWARDERVSESLVYNMLAARKPYARTRARLAERLGVGTAIVDHLIESRRAVPTAHRGPPADDAVDTPPPAIDWSAAPYARHRDRTNPIERRAVRVVEADVASMPASTVVGLAMWPESLSQWSRSERLKSSVVWATLSGSPSAPVRDALARRLGVSLRSLDALVIDARAPSVARRPPMPSTSGLGSEQSRDRSDPTKDATPADVSPHHASTARTERDVLPRTTSHDADEQLGLGF